MSSTDREQKKKQFARRENASGRFRTVALFDVGCAATLVAAVHWIWGCGSPAGEPVRASAELHAPAAVVAAAGPEIRDGELSLCLGVHPTTTALRVAQG